MKEAFKPVLKSQKEVAKDIGGWKRYGGRQFLASFDISHFGG